VSVQSDQNRSAVLSGGRAGILATAFLLATCGHLETRDAELVKDVEPIYPEHARERGVEGRVIVEYTISEEGLPVDVRIVESVPPGVFDAVAINAISQWRYIPARRTGRRVESPQAEAVFTFRITNGDPETTADAVEGPS